VEGDVEGLAEGPAVGFIVGEVEGDVEGLAEGPAVEFIVGEVVGDDVAGGLAWAINPRTEK